MFSLCVSLGLGFDSGTSKRFLEGGTAQLAKASYCGFVCGSNTLYRNILHKWYPRREEHKKRSDHVAIHGISWNNRFMRAIQADIEKMHVF